MGSTRVYTALAVVVVTSLILYIGMLNKPNTVHITLTEVHQGLLHQWSSLLQSIINMDFDSSSSTEDCEVIHIAIVCTGVKASSDVIPVIKSIAFFRRNPLHFHFISDIKAENILKQQFIVWNMTEVDVSFYSSEKAKKFVSWVPNNHYSGIYAMLKLTLTEILPQYIQKVIVLDTDVLCVCDISELWKTFRSFNESQAIGLTENLSKWYLNKVNAGRLPWPALGRGFNTGVILLDVHKLRKMNWTELWGKITSRKLAYLKHTQLGDQDIINAVMVHHPFMVYRLHCKWNVQLKPNRATCSKEMSTFKIVHWNSEPARKFGSFGTLENTSLSFFTKQRQMFLQSDINRDRRSTLPCNVEETM